MDTFTKNLKRLRLAKHLTQEQAAEALGISTQTVSRWECGTTLPDVTVLPKIAQLYCVTVDDLYRETSVAYDNYAQRLGSIHEATRRPEDFIRADLEYRKLLGTGEYTTEDLRLYAILHQYMMEYCMEKAGELFDRVLRKGPGENAETYWSVQRQKGYYLWQIGRNAETIQHFLPLVEADSNEIQEWVCLIQAYQFAGEYDTAWDWVRKAAEKFPESAMLHIYSGDLCKSLQRYEEAFAHWKRALEMEPDWCDAAYSMGFCYEELGNYEKAWEVWHGIAESLIRRGFDAETNWPRQRAEQCQEKLAKQKQDG